MAPDLRPNLNLDDIPEMMPGAQPGATAVERARFEARSKQLHREAEEEAQEVAQETRTPCGSAETPATPSEIEGMFPALDAALVRTLYAEASSPEAGMNTLLALSAATNEPGPEGLRPISQLPRDIGVGDESKFPTLTDADGWQIVAPALFERDPDADLGNEWAARTKAAATVPQPQQSRTPQGAWGRRRKLKDTAVTRIQEPLEHLTDYDVRHLVGQRRVQKKQQYGRNRSKAGGSGGGVRGSDEDSPDD